MDKLTMAIFFLFFAFSFARTPSTEQENDIINIKLPSTLAETDAKHVQEKQDHLPEPRDKKIKALPLTLVRLHPINRHFRVRSKPPSLLCHHHHCHHEDNLKPRIQSTYLDDEIPYGNDMIPSDDDDDFDHVFPGGLRQVPQEWMSFLHHNNEDDDDDDDDEQKMSKFIIKRNNHDKFGKMKLKGRLYDPIDDGEEDEDDKISAMQHEDHHSFEKKKMKKHLHRHHEDGNEAHKEEKKTGGFVRHIRKFLDNYFD